MRLLAGRALGLLISQNAQDYAESAGRLFRVARSSADRLSTVERRRRAGLFRVWKSCERRFGRYSGMFKDRLGITGNSE